MWGADSPQVRPQPARSTWCAPMSAGASFLSLSFFSFLSLSSSFSLESKCSLQMWSSCCTFRTFPEPADGWVGGESIRHKPAARQVTEQSGDTRTYCFSFLGYTQQSSG